MAPVRAPEGSSDENYDNGKLSPREIIAKQEGAHFTSPFCDLLAKWTEKGEEYDRAWPREGSFDPEDIALAEDCIRYEEGDLRWDFSYMQKCLAKWERYVEDRPVEPPERECAH